MLPIIPRPYNQWARNSWHVISSLESLDFIGSSLAHELVKQGHEVSGFDNLSTGNLENLAAIRSSINFQEMDLQDKRV
jgi:UDP-glucose 4-epimerase